jgi:hypothetical protein
MARSWQGAPRLPEAGIGGRIGKGKLVPECGGLVPPLWIRPSHKPGKLGLAHGRVQRHQRLLGVRLPSLLAGYLADRGDEQIGPPPPRRSRPRRLSFPPRNLTQEPAPRVVYTTPGTRPPAARTRGMASAIPGSGTAELVDIPSSSSELVMRHETVLAVGDDAGPATADGRTAQATSRPWR